MKVALAQMCSTADPWENLWMVQNLCEEAQNLGVQFICFPENVFYRGPKKLPSGDSRNSIHIRLKKINDAHYTLDPHNEFSNAVWDWLKEQKIFISLGSVFEEEDASLLPFNSHLLWDPISKSIHVYRKIHLFDFESPQVIYRESDDVRAGSEIRSVSVHGFTTGLSICFDLRFPELFRKLVLEHDSKILLVPAAFTAETGKYHWHALLRARAIENQCFVLATGQWGPHYNSKGQKAECYGHSLIYDPWGELLIEGPAAGDALLVYDLEAEQLARVREKLPALKSTRLSTRKTHH